MRKQARFLAALSAATSLIVLAGCGPSGGGDKGATKGGAAGGDDRIAHDAAQRTFVPPGQLDDYYLFYSGGHSGQVYLAGIPSMRHIATIPVFTPYPGTGYGYDEESKKMLGGYTWGDVHHPSLSKTNGDYDGRWLFVNDNANNRAARIDLRDMKTHQIIKIPNVSGNHGSAFVTNNTEYILSASRFSAPLAGGFAPVSQYKTAYHGIVAGVKIDPKTGNMSNGFQIKMPPLDFDLGSTGKGPSEGWAFWTSYNSERATGRLEVTASKNPKDYVVACNWKAAEAAVKAGKADMVGGVPVIDPAKVPGIVYLLPTPSSPHGVDVTPDGKYMAASGKLAPVVTIFDFAKLQAAIDKKDFTGDEDGVPVVKFESVKTAEVPVGMGPLHTEYDDQGNAYTSLFLESAVAKWKVGTWEVLDKIPVAYNVGHIAAAGGNTSHPYGKYLVSLNKLSKGRHITTGPSQPESSQLIDITGNKMTMLYETFTEPEPHYAQIIKTDAIKPIEVYPKDENKNPNAIWNPNDATITRNGKDVTIKMFTIRTFFAPTEIAVNKGDRVTIHVTNAEQTRDEIHGLGISEYNLNVVIDPGETKTVSFVADKPGVFPFYCTNFCSALHQEMQGYLTVKP
ncbi:MAG TPA: Sec-dependent nitrous-oxide reductase [Pantanalinema sp.]